MLGKTDKISLALDQVLPARRLLQPGITYQIKTTIPWTVISSFNVQMMKRPYSLTIIRLLPNFREHITKTIEEMA
jgi:hypothetical protein